ncbi:hypothetical protein A2533_04300 [Candidatus Falkowbacteria bacterium RIFOXYD2_FULL_35_9]|uniref:Uncharacterized protein n=1 Tax=Candidatus Falkowbacteria bacterium RIFOXYC2_FULL_36_12 TaxID=1798002 RepID=A0A1F5SYY2_9BACT|nr:MAG: hypothetical protein A2300_03575 [Candidatus Falkowbacteria bacterium RIFOXYB2_FULL_35_7]OGF31927.1 MAG: hypothetical protein A2478_05520 [Candidatus Falkowbacteria bacterium RIFOXYC2_FULL_36_12]OGF34680.1 MAG: hypothetical protein A2223_02920 [Candidatus Falkowbacteria bacterium RIFOXYA2_FULL_35_8]OGF46114.1 MAG: hypothetical protein A2533_04300 [Candidatus Falkowbacteria bacterium RIFOXYD2_FULL_35_9]
MEDVLNAVNTSAELMQQQINEIKSTMATKDDIANMATKDDIANMATKDDIANMATKDDLANLVTKDYLDEKLADLRGDLVVLTRKEDTKLKRLVNIMTNKNMLSSEEKAEIFALEPFPETRL